MIGRLYYYWLAKLIMASNRLYEFRGRAFDAWHGVETVGHVAVCDLALPDNARIDAVHYEPTKISVFDHVISRLPIENKADFAFVDFGSGKGRCLLLAARSGFRSVVGVDLSERLCKVARTNLAVFANGKFAATISIQCVDSTEAVLPDGPSVFYFYNPFGPAVMQETLKAVCKHLNASAAESFLIFVNADHNENAVTSGFHLVDSGRKRNEPWTIWHRPAGAARSVRAAQAA